MRLISKTKLKSNILKGIGYTLIAALVIGLLIFAFISINSIEKDIYEKKAKLGSPSFEVEEVDYQIVSLPGVFTSYALMLPRLEGKNLAVYLTNPEDQSDILLMVTIYEAFLSTDANGKTEVVSSKKVLAQSGFIRGGEYIDFITLKKKIDNNQIVSMRISARDLNTGLSLGNQEFATRIVFETNKD